MSVTVRSFTIHGATAIPVTVEVDLLNRLPATTIVGLPAGAVKEAAERVRSAIEASGFTFPRRRIVVNLLPADLRKNTTGLDLAIAVAILIADGQIENPGDDFTFFGELSLAGAVRPVRGTLAAVRATGDGVLVTAQGVEVARAAGRPYIEIVDLASVAELDALVASVRAKPLGSDLRFDASAGRSVPPPSSVPVDVLLALIRALQQRRPLLLVGLPGSGKTRIARELARTLGAPTEADLLEILTIHDAAGLLHDARDITGERPFRAPHHTVTIAGMAGDRSGRLGECTLAKHGTLFLDEVALFSREALNAVRASAGACALIASTVPEDLSRVDAIPFFAGCPRAFIG